ncbi:MAG TPA: hypothetical protein PLQ82_04175 [Desulfobacteraceae bacterium]|nr:hypothetical protein [Desulfobacteraceae bacterium]
MLRYALRSLIVLSILAVVIMIGLPCSAGFNGTDIPPELARWKPWVLHGLEEKLCPTHFNDGRAYQCVWPTRIELTVDSDRGLFKQEWLVFAESWVPLPGDQDVWPLDVEVDGDDAPVVGRASLPCIFLTPGEHTVKGGFKWATMPESIHIPPSSGLVHLKMNGHEVEFPVLDKDGRLWLQKREKIVSSEDVLETRIFRLIEDNIPMQVINRIQLNVSGQAREIHLKDVLLKGSLPTDIESPLPARIGPEGDLLVQGRPGRWWIHINSRFEGPVSEIGPVAGLYGQEIWSFRSSPHLRMVNVTGVPSVDPSRTDLPVNWKSLPAYVMQPDSTISFRELRRGDPEPAPDALNLYRTWWLDFDGKGFTVQDHISGTMSRQWYLAMNPPGMLGRVAVDGVDQLITAHGEDKKPGVELRRGNLDMTAESRYEACNCVLPAVGWDHNVLSLKGTLNLSPGWRLLNARGIDVLPGTWFQQWTLLDLFIVLIIGLALFKLRGWPWGCLGLVTMCLIYHEPGAPRIVWLNLLAVLALMKVLPKGFIRRTVFLWGIVAGIYLLVLAIPFMVNQIRCGIYPQLEQPARIMPRVLPDMAGAPRAVMEKNAADTVSRARGLYKSTLPSMARIMKEEEESLEEQSMLQQDPNALIQTGPGVPSWNWRSFEMKWNGPVDKEQELRLWLLSPEINLLLAFLRTILLAMMIVGTVDRTCWKSIITHGFKAGTVLLVLLSFSLIAGPGDRASAAENSYPPQNLLEELQKRMLEPPDCLPYCADFLDMDLQAKEDGLRILLKVHAAVQNAVPLPAKSETWFPSVVLIDRGNAEGLYKDSEGVLWALVPKGIHNIVLTGTTGSRHAIQIPLYLKPRHATASAEGWDIQGISPEGKVDASIQLTRKKKEGKKIQAMTESFLPPFLNVERVFHLGLTWQISTTIERLTPTGMPVVISIPLMDGESVTTEGISTKDSYALINMGPNQRVVRFVSSLKTARKLTLSATRDVPWTETWILDASPIWHCDFSGIPVIHHQDRQGQWRPEWKPWPGESVDITISRPKAISGQIVTIDSAELDWTPGMRFDKARLNLSIRTSRGGQHNVSLPEGAELQFVKIDGKSHPVRQEGQQVTIPLHPGSQMIQIEWQQPGGSNILTKGPLVRIGEQAVNAKVTFNMPRSRWILLAGGPRLGPAVLLWSYIFVILLGAVILGRTSITPLKTFQWILLGLGLTQISPLMTMVIVGWLLALGMRRKHVPPPRWFAFNGAQVLLTVWTGVALFSLYTAIERGLLGIPDMQITGNFSSSLHLHWTHDRIGEFMPQPWVLSLHKMIYHILMLAWALWLAFSLIRWFRWGWQCYSEGGIWRKFIRRRKKDKEAQNEVGAKKS